MTRAHRVLPYGRRAVLVEPVEPGLVLALAEAARALDGVVEVVPAARTVLVRCADDAAAGALAGSIAGLEVVGTGGTAGGEVTIEVRYDGPDLGPTADELGMPVDELVRRHAAGEYVVAFCGFAPGFAYLTGLDPSLHVPRLAEPRTRVPDGAVAIAGEFAGVYPRASPGGWRLLGSTDAQLWDVANDPPSPLVPGTRVTFRAAERP